MHPGQQRIIAPIIEVRHAALLGTEIAHRRGQTARRQPKPAQTHGHLDIEIEATHPWLTAHDSHQRLYGIDAEAEQRIVNAGPERPKIGPPVRDLAALDTHPRCTGVEKRLAQNQRLWLLDGGSPESAEGVGPVLAVPIHTT